MADSVVWTAMSDALVRGAHHELNNRVASLSAVEQVIASGAGDTPSLREALVSELRRMRGAIDLLGRIPAATPGSVTAMRMQDALAAAVELIPLHHEVRDVVVRMECEGDPLPVRADPAAVERSILVMIAAAARSLPDAAESAVRLECSSTDGGRTQIRTLPLEMTEAERHAIAAWLRPFDGDISRVDSRGYSLSLPTISSTRP